jgi:hypothetical protein
MKKRTNKKIIIKKIVQPIFSRPRHRQEPQGQLPIDTIHFVSAGTDFRFDQE